MSSYLSMSGDAAAEALSMVAAVRDDPARRVDLAGRFYDDRPGCVPIRSYRRAELAFMRWQVRRGLLAAPDAPRAQCLNDSRMCWISGGGCDCGWCSSTLTCLRRSASSRLARSMLKPFLTTMRITAVSVRSAGNV